MKVQNIIFDFGGIFIDIDYQKTRLAFIGFGIAHFDAFYQQAFSNPLFSNLETGHISEVEFYEAFRADTGIALTNHQIKEAWNALLGDYRKASVAILPIVKEQYQTYLLSNTNIIHYDAFIEKSREQLGNQPFDDFFHKAYYSHQMGLRKPNADSYTFILDAHGLLAAETLFVDDTYKNIEGAQAVGLQTLWLENGLLIEDALPEFLGW